MTERTLVTISATCISEVELTPNVFLAFIGFGICRFAPRGLLGLGFRLRMSFGLALRKHRGCAVRFSIPFVRFPFGSRCRCLGRSGKKVLPFQHLAYTNLCLSKVGLFTSSHKSPIDFQEVAVRSFGIIIGQVLIMWSKSHFMAGESLVLLYKQSRNAFSEGISSCHIRLRISNHVCLN